MTEALGGAWVLTAAGWVRGGRGPINPPPTQPMLLGADVLSVNQAGASWSTWTARTAKVGEMGIRRSYDTGMPTTWANSQAARTSGHGIVNWLSVRPNAAAMAAGTLDTAVTAFANSIPAGEQVILTPLHEPENNTNQTSAATWRAAVQRFYTVVKAARPSTRVGPVLQGWTWDPKSGRSVADWTIPAAYCDFYGIDFYNGYHYPLTGNSPIWTPPIGTQVANFQAFCDNLGVQGACGEFGSSDDTTLLYQGVQATTANPNPQHKIDWAAGYIDYAHKHGWLAMCYFDAYKPGDTDPSIVLDSTTQFQAFWQGQCAAHPSRVLP